MLFRSNVCVTCAPFVCGNCAGEFRKGCRRPCIAFGGGCCCCCVLFAWALSTNNKYVGDGDGDVVCCCDVVVLLATYQIRN